MMSTVDFIVPQQHKHCVSCFKSCCSSAECAMCNCPDCGVRMHICKLEDHREGGVCLRAMSACPNALYGCTARMRRHALNEHIQHCPASLLLCPFTRNRHFVSTRAKTMLKRIARGSSTPKATPSSSVVVHDLQHGHACPPDIALAHVDQLTLEQSFRLSRSKRLSLGVALRRQELEQLLENNNNNRQELEQLLENNNNNYNNIIDGKHFKMHGDGVKEEEEEDSSEEETKITPMPLSRCRPLPSSGTTTTKFDEQCDHFFVLLGPFLDDASLRSLSTTCRRLRHILPTLLRNRLSVELRWEKKKKHRRRVINDSAGRATATANYEICGKRHFFGTTQCGNIGAAGMPRLQMQPRGALIDHLQHCACAEKQSMDNEEWVNMHKMLMDRIKKALNNVLLLLFVLLCCSAPPSAMAIRGALFRSGRSMAIPLWRPPAKNTGAASGYSAGLASTSEKLANYARPSVIVDLRQVVQWQRERAFAEAMNRMVHGNTERGIVLEPEHRQSSSSEEEEDSSVGAGVGATSSGQIRLSIPALFGMPTRQFSAHKRAIDWSSSAVTAADQQLIQPVQLQQQKREQEQSQQMTKKQPELGHFIGLAKKFVINSIDGL
uniref:TRAF-type domain-containing protein n=1 Tax=Globodera pallida TaxID=36090 RepID=A0A183BZL9_GLOPA